MRAINYYIVLEKIKEKPKSNNGFDLTEAQNQDIKYSRGKIISVGEKVEGIKEDDIVLFNRNAGNIIEWDGNYYYVIGLGDVVIVE